MGTWQWNLEAKILHKSHRRVETQLKASLLGEVSLMDDNECFQPIFSKDPDNVFGHDQGPIIDVLLS